MTREHMKAQILIILDDIEPTALDDSGLYIPDEEKEEAAERILKLWEYGYTWELPK